MGGGREPGNAAATASHRGWGDVSNTHGQTTAGRKWRGEDRTARRNDPDGGQVSTGPSAQTEPASRSCAPTSPARSVSVRSCRPKAAGEHGARGKETACGSTIWPQPPRPSPRCSLCQAAAGRLQEPQPEARSQKPPLGFTSVTLRAKATATPPRSSNTVDASIGPAGSLERFCKFHL